jgi:hypothetical protein
MSYDKIGRLLLTLETEGGNEQLLDTSRNALTEQLRLARDEGRPVLPKPAYGYRREVVPGEFRHKKDGRMVPTFRWEEDGAAAEVVRSVFRWYAEGRSVGWIAAELDRRGVAPPVSRHRDAEGRLHWRRATLRGILSNPIYVGRRAWGKTASGKFHRLGAEGKLTPGDGTRKTTRRPPSEWFIPDGDDGIPALIDRDLWTACQSRLCREKDEGGRVDAEGRRAGHKRHCPTSPTAEPGAFLLSRLLVCGKCGAWMTGFRKPEKCKPGVGYVCSAYVAHSRQGACVRCAADEEATVREVVEALRERLLLADRLDWLTQRLNEHARQQKAEDNLSRLRKDVAALEAKRDRCRARLVEVSRDMVPEVEEQLRQTRAALEAAQQALRNAEDADPVRDLKFTVEAARKALWRLEEALEGGDRSLLAEALRGVLARVVIGHEEYQTTTDKTRRRPVVQEIVLRPGSGLDTLAELVSNLDGSPSARSR